MKRSLLGVFLFFFFPSAKKGRGAKITIQNKQNEKKKSLQNFDRDKTLPQIILTENEICALFLIPLHRKDSF